MQLRVRRGDGWSGAREGSLAARSPEACQEPPGAAKAERKRHLVSLGGPRRTLVRRSCPTDEGPLPLRPRSCAGPALHGVGCMLGTKPGGGSPLRAGICRIALG